MYFLYQKKFLQSWILNQSSSLDQIIGYLLFSYSALTIRIVRIVFGTHKMNEYEYQIPLFGPNYSNSRIVQIIRPNTAMDIVFCILQRMSSKYHSGPAPRVSRARTRDHSADLYLKHRCVSTLLFNSRFVNDSSATEAAQLISVAPGHLYWAPEQERGPWTCPTQPSGPGTVIGSLNYP